MRAFVVEFLVLILREIVELDVVAQVDIRRASAVRCPASSLISVDLPAPLTPTSAMRSPRSMMKSTLAKTVLLAVALRDTLELRDNAAARLGLRKGEVNRLLLGRQLDALDLLEFLDPALHLLGLGRLVAEAVDEGFELLDPLLLIAIRRFELRAALGLLREILLVIAAVEVQTCLFQISTILFDGDVEEIAVVRDQDERVRVIRSDIPPASCALRDPGGWSARRAAADWACSSSSLASAMRICQPPENSSVRRFQSLCGKPRPLSTVPTCASMA